MSAYVIVQVTVRDAETYERYKALVPPSIAAYGGRFLVRGGTSQTLEGTWRPMRIVILEFPSAERARQWWSSPEYAVAKALRQSSADTEMLLVEGLSDEASASLTGTGQTSAAR
jgi:uncharacterized protein (DUF1330 family)